ncbi:RNA 3'-phosphate cyclase [Candidatus Woesearchaeota archaeon]|nr:RNA 3'-phosphate cyclase [Candidatus Woesearchaeota archaeon]|tara:strand:+ start:10634 stop:11728 length:1095 start_codon:yes stop_codon:yes gene_type:complete
MIQIDGSFHEGGGQILRTALGLSALTKQPFEITNIRKNRPKPGLRYQHLSCVKAVAELCNGSYEGAEVSSTAVKFYPRNIKSRTLSVDIGTAGSITLLLQSLIVPVIFGDKKFRIKITGGPDSPFSPPSDYFAYVLIPHLKKFCDVIDYKVIKRGFIHKGGGKTELFVKLKFPVSNYSSFEEFTTELQKNTATKINLANQGKLLQIKGSSIASNDLQKAEVAERQAKAAKMALTKLNVPINISTNYSDSLSTGSVITLWAVFSDSDEVSQINPIILGSNSLGERGKRAEDVGKETALQLLNEINSKAPVDKHLADQLLPFLALTTGQAKVSEITPHCLTNIYTIEKFLGKCFEVDKENKIIKSA